MISLWDAVVAWFGWNILAPVLFIVGLFVLFFVIAGIAEGLDAIDRWRRKP